MTMPLKLKVAAALLVFIGGPLFVMWLIGHTTLKSGAKTFFASKFSCPEDRVVVTLRDDVRYGELVFARRVKTAEEPPAEVAADPGRMDKWNSDLSAARESTMREYEGHRVFDLHGCNHAAAFACWHPVVEDAEGPHTKYGEVRCEKVTLPAPGK